MKLSDKQGQELTEIYSEFGVVNGYGGYYEKKKYIVSVYFEKLHKKVCQDSIPTKYKKYEVRWEIIGKIVPQ